MKAKNSKNKTYVILHNIRSVHNVGSIFRTAEAAGVDKIFCTGFTPTPTDRFGRKRDDFSKVALGAEENISWEEAEDPLTVITNLQENDVRVVAVEITDEAVDYHSLESDIETAVVFGNEVDGVPAEVISAADLTAAIPMHGEKSSLNVSVAAGIMLYTLKRKADTDPSA